MRAALIDPSLFTLPYDAALAKGLERAGVEVALHGRALLPEDGSANGISVRPSFYRVADAAVARRLPKAARLAVKGVDHLVSMRRLLGQFRRNPPDVIHFQWLPLPGLDARMLPAFREIAPVILTVHDTDPFNGSPTARLQSLGFTRSLRGCDRLIVHTAQGAARLKALDIPPAKIRQLPHGSLAANDFSVAPDPMDGEMLFVLFGKIKPYKGTDLLIEAFARLPEALRARARLRIVGQAYMNVDELRALAQARHVADRVEFDIRFVEDNEIASVFAPGSVAAFPYREIEASGVLSLALAAGRPVIASRLGSFAEIIEDGREGRLLPAGDVTALSEAMAAVIADRSLAARYAAGARERAGALPGWDDIARMTRRLYQDAIDAARPRPASQIAAPRVQAASR
jgi:glycosyltransferase involved in cell wall biosynthesis